MFRQLTIRDPEGGDGVSFDQMSFMEQIRNVLSLSHYN